jgi:galactoside O-acetyltransferase
MNSFYSESELDGLGLKSIGRNVLISRKASIYSPETISLGNHVRIDDFCILSGKIRMGSYVHISAFTALYAGYGITIGDYCGLSPRCTVFSATDDFSGDFLIGPLLPDELTNVSGGEVIMENYVQIGAGSIVLPGVTIQEGVAVGSMSLINKSLEPWGIYLGIPAKFHNQRNRKILDLVKEHFGKQ